MGLGRGFGARFGMGSGFGAGPAWTAGGGLGMGARGRAPDDKGLKSDKLKSKLAGQGEINDVQSFKGIPEEGHSTIELRNVLQSASQAAEEALGREEIPRKRAEAVKKYFEGVKPR